MTDRNVTESDRRALQRLHNRRVSNRRFYDDITFLSPTPSIDDLLYSPPMTASIAPS